MTGLPIFAELREFEKPTHYMDNIQPESAEMQALRRKVDDKFYPIVF